MAKKPYKPKRPPQPPNPKHLEWARLRRVEGYSVRAIAEHYGVAEVTVYKALSRLPITPLSPMPVLTPGEPIEPMLDRSQPTSDIPCTSVRWKRENIKIIDNNKDVVPFVYWKAQRYLHAICVQLEKFNLQRNIVCGKTRKFGGTTFAVEKLYTKVRKKPNSYALIVAHDSDTMQTDFEMAVTNHVNLPEAELERLPLRAKDPNRPNKLDLEFKAPHRGVIRCRTAGAKEIGRGLTPSAVLFDELAFWKDDVKNWTAVYNSLPKPKDSRDLDLFVISTANGVGNIYHKIYTESYKPKSWFDLAMKIREWAKTGYTPWIGLFFGLWGNKQLRIPAHPGCAIPLTEGEIKATEEAGGELQLWDDRLDQYRPLHDTERAYRDKHNISAEQIKWVVYTVHHGFQGNWEKFKQEHPGDDEEMFLYSGGAVFDGTAIQVMRKTVVVPTFRGDIDFKPDLIEPVPDLIKDIYGHLEIWEYPDPNGVYVGAGDISEGAGQDYHEGGIALVGLINPEIDRGWHPIDPRLVARYRSNENQFMGSDFAVKLYLMGLLYNQALLVVERNGVGMVAIDMFVKGHAEYPHTIDFKYPFLYSYLRTDRITAKEEEVIGFYTSQGPKEIAISHLANMIHRLRWRIPCEGVLNQLEGFCRNPQKAGRNKWQEKFQDPLTRAYNDDSVAMMMLIEAGRRWLIEHDFPILKLVR